MKIGTEGTTQGKTTGLRDQLAGALRDPGRCDHPGADSCDPSAATLDKPSKITPDRPALGGQLGSRAVVDASVSFTADDGTTWRFALVDGGEQDRLKVTVDLTAEEVEDVDESLRLGYRVRRPGRRRAVIQLAGLLQHAVRHATDPDDSSCKQTTSEDQP